MISLGDVAAELAAAVRVLSRHRYGVIMIWDPATTVEGGIVLDALVSRQLLITIFSPESTNQLRTGVVVVRGARIERAGVPITWQHVVERAAELAAGVILGVDEDTGAVRLVDVQRRVTRVNEAALLGVLASHALGGRAG